MCYKRVRYKQCLLIIKDMLKTLEKYNSKNLAFSKLSTQVKLFVLISGNNFVPNFTTNILQYKHNLEQTDLKISLRKLKHLCNYKTPAPTFWNQQTRIQATWMVNYQFAEMHQKTTLKMFMYQITCQVQNYLRINVIRIMTAVTEF